MFNPLEHSQPIASYSFPFLAWLLRIFQRQQVGERDQRSHSLHLFYPRRLRTTVPGDLLDLLVAFVNPLAQRFDGGQQWFRCLVKARSPSSRMGRTCCAGSK